MHQQVRVSARLSPPDLEKLLKVIEDAGINIAAAGGGNLEFNGEFAFAVDHGSERKTIDALNAAGYSPRLIAEDDPRLTVRWLTNRPGELRKAVAEVAAENLDRGRIIQDLIVGSEDDRFGVQIYSEEVRTRAALEHNRD
jgi:hypothetical protein